MCFVNDLAKYMIKISMKKSVFTKEKMVSGDRVMNSKIKVGTSEIILCISFDPLTSFNFSLICESGIIFIIMIK